MCGRPSTRYGRSRSSGEKIARTTVDVKVRDGATCVLDRASSAGLLVICVRLIARNISLLASSAGLLVTCDRLLARCI